MDKFNNLTKEIGIYTEIDFPNKDDWNQSFWKKDYVIYLTAHGIPFAVNADNEQDAIDYVIDYCEENYPGLIMTREEEEEEFLDDYVCGGNHSRYLYTYNIHIKEL